MPDTLVSLLQQVSPLPDSDKQLITSAWSLRMVKEGDVLSVAGKICQELFFIKQGVLRIVVQQESGKEVTHFFLKENQFCTILHSFTNQLPATESIQAACASEILAISRQQLDVLYLRLPYLKSIIDQIIQQGLLDKVRTRNAYLGQDSTARYAHFLALQPEIAGRVSLSDIASYLGITPQSLSRIRKNHR